MAKNVKQIEDNKINLDEVKSELKDYVDIKIKNGFDEELDRAHKRLIKEKNKKILFRNVVIIILLALIGFLLFLLYKANFFDKFFSKCEEVKVVEVKEDEEEAKEEVKVTLEDLIKKYSYLIDNIKISEESEYIKDFYSGNISNELKEYLAINNADFKSFSVDDDYNIIDSSLIESEYNKLFDDKYEAVSFVYNGNKLRYLDKLNSFISDSVLEKSSFNIKREIVNIKEENNKVEIECIEGLVKDDKLYNILTSKEVNYKDGSFVKYEKELNKVVYTFNNGKLESVK